MMAIDLHLLGYLKDPTQNNLKNQEEPTLNPT